ncbi:Endonuclease/exonuclease/phosphatase [Irpex rosettiformis]|uniref:Endonuclease/exonuclease/phosphatase n=1 Tax=Irpex rosettiformis TaxID=378272 RepID=A0ACB8UEL0_9APHY|nr:Endonuclease/exonuclease/phosphatase [Irpex rosettiformis]
MSDTDTQGPSQRSTTILSWNIETPVPFFVLPTKKTGSLPNHAKARPHHLRELVARHDYPDFLCLQEVLARLSDVDWIADLGRAVNGRIRDRGPKYTPYMSLNRSTRGQRHFGTVTFAKHPESIERYREVEWDSEGRVVILEMKSGWALVNVYALNGSEAPWKDPTGEGLPKSRNERKREFNRLLLKECQEMQKRGLRLVLIGDFNISLTALDCYPRLRMEYPHMLARKEFNEKFIPGANVVDIFREVHGDCLVFSWFAKGKPQGADCARVDYALVERTLISRVLETGYLEDSGERAHSDHAPVWLALQDMHNLDISPR